MKVYLLRESDIEALLLAIQPAPSDVSRDRPSAVAAAVDDERRRVTYAVHKWLDRVKADMP